MAAALLMMNMQGAVMAADKDLTIFRYSDKVPFALMTDPTSKLPWGDIWNGFRINSDVTNSYLRPLEDYLKSALPKYADSISKEMVFCVFYEQEEIFPSAYNMVIQMNKGQVVISKGNASFRITPLKSSSYVNWLGNLNHMGTIMGDSLAEIKEVICSVYPELVAEFRGNALIAAQKESNKTEIEEILSNENFETALDKVFDKTDRLFQQKLDTAINSYHIEDMVRMSDKLIEAEAQLQHLHDPQTSLRDTKEIATMTLAEGFRWIKHSLYGA